MVVSGPVVDHVNLQYYWDVFTLIIGWLLLMRLRSKESRPFVYDLAIDAPLKSGVCDTISTKDWITMTKRYGWRQPKDVLRAFLDIPFIDAEFKARLSEYDETRQPDPTFSQAVIEENMHAYLRKLKGLVKKREELETKYMGKSSGEVLRAITKELQVPEKTGFGDRLRNARRFIVE